MTSPSDRQREDKAHGAAVACAARGADVAGGRPCRREVVGGGQATTASPCMRGHVLARTRGHGPTWAAGKRALPLF
jgi:hypothetical protein